jgi:hypothetical protein
MYGQRLGPRRSLCGPIQAAIHGAMPDWMDCSEMEARPTGFRARPTALADPVRPPQPRRSTSNILSNRRAWCNGTGRKKRLQLGDKLEPLF